MLQYKTLPPLPLNTTKYAYGHVAMTMVGTVTDMLHVLSDSPPLVTHYPVNMEQTGQACCFNALFSMHFVKMAYGIVVMATGNARRGLGGLSPQNIVQPPHCETYWSRIRR